MAAIPRPALRYHGGKWKLAQWIIKHFPAHECYVEPYGGAASVLLQKPRSALEVYNDLDSRVVHFFRVLRERPDDLVRSLELTPYSREEYELSHSPAEDDLEAARRFYVRAYMGIGGATSTWRSGWRYQVRAHNLWRPASTGFSSLDHLHAVAERMRGVQIENDDAFAVVERFDRPSTLFYLDPPYVHATRSKWAGNAYQHEMTDVGHIQLAELLRGLHGMAVLSGYPDTLYAEQYEEHGWVRLDRLSRTNSQRSPGRVEGLWLSPRVVEARRNRQLPLLSVQEVQQDE